MSNEHAYRFDDADASASSSMLGAPGKRTRSERLPTASAGGTEARVGGTEAQVGGTELDKPIGLSNQVGGTSFEDPFALHIEDASGGGGPDLADARRFNRDHTPQVVRFNTLTGGYYAPPGGGQFDPEDIMAWQEDHQLDDPEHPLTIDGRLTPETMAAAEKKARPMRKKGQPHDPKLDPKPEPKPDPKPHGHDGIIGLRHGDGIDKGTEHLRRFVRKLQQLLNEHSDDHDSVLDVNGRFDDDTLDMLQEFQKDRAIKPANAKEVDKATADALHAGRKGKQPSPNPNPDPQPPAQYNPELENLLDAIWLQHQATLLHAINATHKLDIDLAKPVAGKQNLLRKILVFALRSVLHAMPDLAAIAIMMREGLPENDTIGASIKAPFDVLKDDTEKWSESVIPQFVGPKPQPEGARDFVSAQRTRLIDGSVAVQEKFLLQGKPALRRTDDLAAWEAKHPCPRDADWRLARAREALEIARSITAGAEQKQYLDSLAAWGTAMARGDLGDVDKNHAERGVDLSSNDKLDDARGVIEMHFVGDENNPARPLTPIMSRIARVRGLSKESLAHLDGQRLADVHMPVVARVIVNQGPFEIMVGKSGSTVWNGVPYEAGRERERSYLATKGVGPGAAATPENAHVGAIKAMSEIEPTRIGEAKSDT
jgi:hypothetical protein